MPAGERSPRPLHGRLLLPRPWDGRRDPLPHAHVQRRGLLPPRALHPVPGGDIQPSCRSGRVPAVPWRLVLPPGCRVPCQVREGADVPAWGRPGDAVRQVLVPAQCGRNVLHAVPRRLPHRQAGRDPAAGVQHCAGDARADDASRRYDEYDHAQALDRHDDCCSSASLHNSLASSQAPSAHPCPHNDHAGVLGVAGCDRVHHWVWWSFRF
mmetsp:Transcript_50919/g.124059  ORF Transcript_50919/g.124059 Transcript_50919/m.124059 type:complete len:210 (+) Transcript_50919:1329-1958(+)